MKMWRRVLAEAQGTALLAFLITASGGNPYAIALGLWIDIVGIGFIGGAHFNPIVTLSVMAKKKYFKALSKHEIMESTAYLVVQFPAAIIGAISGLAIRPSDFMINIGENSSIFQGLFAEAVFTGQMVLVILIVGELMESKLVSALAVAITVLAGILTVGSISGACFNPFVCSSIDIVQYIRFNDSAYIDNLWIYYAGPLIGGIVATIAGCVYLTDSKFTKKRDEETINCATQEGENCQCALIKMV
ncbi:unnamed protein product [Blepharisma stoltei]|uniref:Aquaporin n=1 Tax=Blepharisma stoltei TaxID=1481888 RepID=A0AAU9JY58_9CILI|nr:unnamed protein product [Blepharisma stoltei]